MESIYVHFKQLWYMACEARDQSRDEDARGLLADSAIIAVIMSAIAMEAFINEVTALSVSRTPIGVDAPVERFAAVMSKAVETRADVRLKYQLARASLVGEPFDRGTQPFQDFATLVRLRNWCVHLSPTERRPERIVQQFVQRGFVPEAATYTNDAGQDARSA
jgi:hypothetical protein